jgi:hypothetical protein
VFNKFLEWLLTTRQIRENGGEAAMNRLMMRIAIVLVFVLFASPTWAGLSDWRNHAFPLTFLFGNHIDSHQQTRLTKAGELFGYFYITYTGEYTPEGYPVAHHCDPNTPPQECVVGWILTGKPGQATFLYHNMDHPVWLVESRNEIPQPGAFAHFHWITNQGTDPRPVTDPRCNVSMAEQLQHGAVCPGYFLQLMAVDKFAFHHEDELILVDPGIDIRTHLNILTSVPADCGDGMDCLGGSPMTMP